MGENDGKYWFYVDVRVETVTVSLIKTKQKEETYIFYVQRSTGKPVTCV